MTTTCTTIAPEILGYIKKSKHVLLHCHPSPDPDSIGSVLAMKEIIETLGVKVTAIRGDSVIPEAFGAMPGIKTIVQKSFVEIDLKDFDLMVILDSASPHMISRSFDGNFPTELMTIVIDHHASNEKYGRLNFVDSTYAATAEMVFDLAECWNVPLTPSMGANIFTGMYTDTGGFKYPITSEHTLYVASKCVKVAPDYHHIIFTMENSSSLGYLVYCGLAMSNIKTACGGKFAYAAVSHYQLVAHAIDVEDTSASTAASNLKSVPGFEVAAGIVEIGHDMVKVSLKTRDAQKYDVSKVAVALGGGGHKAAAGILMKMPLEQAIEKLTAEVAKIIS